MPWWKLPYVTSDASEVLTSGPYFSAIRAKRGGIRVYLFVLVLNFRTYSRSVSGRVRAKGSVSQWSHERFCSLAQTLLVEQCAERRYPLRRFGISGQHMSRTGGEKRSERSRVRTRLFLSLFHRPSSRFLFHFFTFLFPLISLSLFPLFFWTPTRGHLRSNVVSFLCVSPRVFAFYLFVSSFYFPLFSMCVSSFFSFFPFVFFFFFFAPLLLLSFFSAFLFIVLHICFFFFLFSFFPFFLFSFFPFFLFSFFPFFPFFVPISSSPQDFTQLSPQDVRLMKSAHVTFELVLAMPSKLGSSHRECSRHRGVRPFVRTPSGLPDASPSHCPSS